LQFAQHKLGDYDHAVNKAGFGDVRDAAVNDNAGIQHLCTAARGPVGREDGAQRRRVQQVAFAGAYQQPHVGHQQQHKYLQHRRVGVVKRRRPQHQAEKGRAEDSQHAASHRPDKPAQAQRPHPQLEDNHRTRGQSPGYRAHPPRWNAERMKKITNPRKQRDKKKTNNYEIHKCLLPLAAR
jgi:hypothetical protein